MTDGLYRVETKHLCAGFVVERGVVTHCAPILRKKINHRKTVAVLIKPENNENHQSHLSSR